ncbi:two-component sensor histidine kinase [Jannaschia pagri]|uniref:histidine kinase n=1 Tax=Jannaschia pagri TaxID=2829797 RepID=A0ABQ4NNY7_9RHOB|nr:MULTISPECIES: ATP-binding protein [unclassified Jannaschia]GIT92104.1 two-component sensor histidine kinase [Jannaschia sp. AI_61]GIT95939.1 two-component sensor histidine kinase [Jannaschia sp. AI_62]
MASQTELTQGHQIIDALLEPAMLLDHNGRVAKANEQAHEWFGSWIDQQSYVSVLRQPDLLAPVEDAFGHHRTGSARFSHSSGAVETLFDVTVTPILGAARRSEVLLVFRDVSAKRVEESMRRDFVANVSHELKTPLTAVMGFIETLQGPARRDAAAQDRFLGLMSQETARMNRLVSDLLALSRLEGLTRRRPTDQVDLCAVLREALDTLHPVAEAAAVTIAFEAPDKAMVLGDRDQLVQIAVNLVENSIKYGARPGQVQISLTYKSREPVLRGPAWAMEVRDDGPGIPPEHLPRLTERFYRVDTGRSREQGGTGLGLSIVKHIVNRHRGRLRIDSREGRGTAMTVVLPAEV